MCFSLKHIFTLAIMSQDLSNVDIQLNDNQIIVYINEKNSHIYKAVRYYCANDEEDPRNRINRVSIKQKFKNRTRKLQTAPMLPTGKSKFYYKDVVFSIQISEMGKPLACEGGLVHEQMYILWRRMTKHIKKIKRF